MGGTDRREDSTSDPVVSSMHVEVTSTTAADRRLAVLSRHLTSGSATGTKSAPTYASATSQPSSYARVHGEVSRAPAVWVAVPVVAKQLLQDVKYDKVEGIAKVKRSSSLLIPL